MKPASQSSSYPWMMVQGCSRAGPDSPQRRRTSCCRGIPSGRRPGCTSVPRDNPARRCCRDRGPGPVIRTRPPAPRIPRHRWCSTSRSPTSSPSRSGRSRFRCRCRRSICRSRPSCRSSRARRCSSMSALHRWSKCSSHSSTHPSTRTSPRRPLRPTCMRRRTDPIPKTGAAPLQLQCVETDPSRLRLLPSTMVVLHPPTRFGRDSTPEDPDLVVTSTPSRPTENNR